MPDYLSTPQCDMSNILQPTSRWITFLATALLFVSCTEYIRVQESTDVREKYSYAKKYYNTKEYKKAAELLLVVAPYLQGTKDGEEAAYLLGQAYYGDEDYESAYQAFVQYYTQYPNGEYAEEAHFYAGYGIAQDPPDPRLDQTQTYSAMKELQSFIDTYPGSDKYDLAKQKLFDLQDHLAEKELLNVELYYNLGNYLFNNYQSAIITAREALKSYALTKHAEELHYYIVASLYQIAKNSVISKQQERLRELRDEYYNYINEFPQGAHRAKADQYFAYATKNIKDEETI